MEEERKVQNPQPNNTQSKPVPQKKTVVVDIRKLSNRNTNSAILAAIFVILLFLGGYLYIKSTQEPAKDVSLTDAIAEVQSGNVTKAIEREGNVYFSLKEKKDSKYKEIVVALPPAISFSDYLKNEGLTITDLGIEYKYEEVSRVPWMDILSIVFMAALAVGVFLFVRNMQASGAKVVEFGKSQARLIWGKKTDINFNDVGGIKESKEELIEIVQFLRNPRKFTRLGARIPKGVLLVGPPGSGKTLLAKAVAGEAGVPFFHTSGSEFEEMLVGAGASRVRDLFRKARRASPSIIFIDEIDAVAKKRGTTLHSGNTEQTLNQILVEMDGLEPSVNVIVMAATNRPDVLDPAILRPGRFDRNIVLSLPDAAEREAILILHARGKKISKEVDFAGIAKRTVGFSGADLENILNEAAIMAAKKDQKEVILANIDESTLKVKYGPERKSRKRAEEDLRMAAYHEAGHALVARFTPETDPVHGVSIISRGMTGGMTMFQPVKDRENTSRNRLMARIAIATGGNVAEKLIFNDVSTGAASDIQYATETARDMVTRYGMSSKLGFVQYGNMDEMSYLGYDYDTKKYSDVTARDIDLEVQGLVEKSWQAAKKILLEHKKELDGLAKLLLERESLDEKEFEAFFSNKSSGKAVLKKSVAKKSK
jgi:cell division protease FtsH